MAAKDRCRLALAGGSTPRAAYERLAAGSAENAVDWSRIDVFFGDERAVPPDDPASNFRMAKEALLDRVKIPEASVHRIRGELGAVAAAERYRAELGTAPLDLVLLGMGDDGHVASLFPASRALEHPDASVLPNEGPVAPHSRVTLSMPVINTASHVLVIVTGAAKATRVKAVFDEQRSGRPVLPAARVMPRGGADWFVDRAAGALLEEELFS